MNRLDFFIARLTAQRASLRLAMQLIENVQGSIMEIGLGKGRTYDFLRDVCSGRSIYAFDRSIGSYPDSTPEMDNIFIGDFRETLIDAAKQLGATAAFAHCDFGSENPVQDNALARWLGPAIDRIMVPGGVIATDREMFVEGWQAIPLPNSVSSRMYFLYQAAGKG